MFCVLFCFFITSLSSPSTVAIRDREEFTCIPKTHHRARHMVEVPTAHALQKLLHLLGNTATDPPNSNCDVASDRITRYLEIKVMRGFMN